MRAEREKRAVILSSEGQRDAAINAAEGQKQQVIKQSEATRQLQINEAEGQASAILAVATATAEGIRKVAESVKAQKNESWQVNEIDGVRVTTPEGWWLLRASNTQNVLVTRAESQNAAGLETLKSMVKKEVERIGYDIDFTG